MEEKVSFGSAGWDEDFFIDSFESCQYPAAQFKHADHIRLAWIYIRRHGVVEAEVRIRGSIRRFATSVGKSEKYHETMTRAWLRLVYAAYLATPDVADFASFAGLHLWLLEKAALLSFYSQQVLSSENARHTWVEPDLRPLPYAATEAPSSNAVSC
jgi:hypothetical protein